GITCEQLDTQRRSRLRTVQIDREQRQRGEMEGERGLSAQHREPLVVARLPHVEPGGDVVRLVEGERLAAGRVPEARGEERQQQRQQGGGAASYSSSATS